MLYESLRSSLANRAARGLLLSPDTLPSNPQTDFSSNDILSFARDTSLSKQFVSRLSSFPRDVSLLGSTGSRTATGTTSYHLTLESRLAEFHNSESALLFNSGFNANLGLWSVLPQQGDVVVYDSLIHASILEGIARCRAGVRRSFLHNNVEELEKILKEVDGQRSIFVSVEGVYSVDGDMAPLKEMVQVMKKCLPRGNGHLLVDEAHSTGVYGSQGRGLVNELGLEKDIPIRLHTFGKALGSVGAVVVCPAIVRSYLINYSRTIRFTTALPLSNLVSISLSYDTLLLPSTTQKAFYTLDLTRKLRTMLIAHGLKLTCKENERTPVIGVLVQQPRVVARRLAEMERGYAVTPLSFPVVPRGGQRIRVVVHAHNTLAEVEAFVAALVDVLEKEKHTVDRAKL